jgi:DNA-binding IclR family transcriptional regulator
MYNAPLLKKAIPVLLFISKVNRPVGVTEISKALSISKSTIYGILKAFQEEGFVHMDSATKRYTIGKELLALAKIIFKGQDMVSIARPFLERLAGLIDETIFLGLKEQDGMRVIDVIEAKKSLKISSPVGTVLPLLAGATGKLILSTMDDKEITAILKEKGLPNYTEKTITDIKTFIKEIKRVRSKGYSTDMEEYLKGVNAIAIPIYQDRTLFGAIWIVGFSNSLTHERLKTIVGPLKEASRQISLRLSLDAEDNAAKPM